MPTLTAFEEFKEAKSFAELSPEADCSIDQLHDMWNAGFLRGIVKNGKRCTTLNHVYEAWLKRAQADLERRGVPLRQPDADKKKPTKHERAHAAAAAMRVKIEG